MNNRLIYWIIILLLSLISCTSKTVDKDAQAKNDSIKKYLELATNDNLDFQKKIEYNDKAYSHIDLNRNDTLTRYHLYRVSYNYHSFNKNDLLKSTAEKLMKLSLKSKDSLNIGRAYRNFGLYYMLKSDNEKAIEYFFKAKKIFKSIQRINYVLKIMGDISLTQAYACDFLGSNKTVIEMLALAKKSNYKNLDFFCYNKIGNNLSLLKNHVEALKYLKIAEKISPSKSNIIRININLAESYIDLKKYDIALKYLNLNLQDNELFSKAPSYYSTSVSLSSYIKLKNNDYSNLEKNFNLAEKYFVLSNSMSGRNYNQIYLSMYYEKINDSVNAIKAAKKAVSISKNYKNPTDILLSLNQLIKVDKKNASANAQEYIRVNDSMQIAERNFRDKFARIVYETDEIYKEKETAIKHNWIIGSIASVVIVIIVLLLIITKQRSKQKELQFQQSQQKANEEIYDLMLAQKSKEDRARQSEKKRIAIELHDGVMNRLASTRLNLNVLSRQNDEETISKCVNQIEGIYKIEQEIRNIAHDLNKEIFNATNSFISLLNDFVVTQNEMTNSKYTLETDPTIDWSTISSSIKMNLYRIIQEASHNVNKHAQASNVMISLILDGNNICLSITDDGKGFDTNVNFEGIGLKNIKHRVKSLKGKVVIQSNTNNTSINITIPFTI